MAAKKGGLGKGLDSLITNKVGISIAEKEKKAEADKDIVFGLHKDLQNPGHLRRDGLVF